jgi:hypothetical protein
MIDLMGQTESVDLLVLIVKVLLVAWINSLILELELKWFPRHT